MGGFIPVAIEIPILAKIGALSSKKYPKKTERTENSKIKFHPVNNFFP